MRKDKQKNAVVISYVMSSEDGRFKKSKKEINSQRASRAN